MLSAEDKQNKPQQAW